MASQDTSNTTAFIESQQYSKFIIENLPDILLPDTFTRDVSDFGTGTTLDIKTIGSTTIQDVAEGVPLTFNPIESGFIQMTISEYTGDAWSVSDELRQDSVQLEQLMAMRAVESTRALAEDVETKFLSAAATVQTAGNISLVNARPHRWVAGNGTTRLMTLDDLVALKLSFDKANVPQAGRILMVDPIVEATVNGLVVTTTATDNNPMWDGMITTGFAQSHKFVKNIMGFDIYTTNFLPVVTAVETLDASGYGLPNDDTVAGDVANIAMCVADDQSKPIMRAWRLQPSTEGWRDSENREDKFQVTSRFGFGAQRVDTLAVIFTSGSAY